MPKYDISQHQFKKGFDPKRNINGAPRKLISTLSGLGYSNRQVSDTILNLLALAESEIKNICENESYTILERIIAKTLIKDFDKGTLWNIETLLSRSIGRPKETNSIEHDKKIEVVFVKGKTIL
jgi:hypothetical protein